MNKMLVAVFDREAAAFEGLTALKDLHRDGDISLYSSAVIAKDKNGKVEAKQAADAGPVGTAVGLKTRPAENFAVLEGSLRPNQTHNQAITGAIAIRKTELNDWK